MTAKELSIWIVILVVAVLHYILRFLTFPWTVIQWLYRGGFGK